MLLCTKMNSPWARKVLSIAKAHMYAGSPLGDAASVDLVAVIFLVSNSQAGNWVKVSTPARDYFSTYITTPEQYQDSVQHAVLELVAKCEILTYLMSCQCVGDWVITLPSKYLLINLCSITTWLELLLWRAGSNSPKHHPHSICPSGLIEQEEVEFFMISHLVSRESWHKVVAPCFEFHYICCSVV